jgi:hypothetical protein
MEKLKNYLMLTMAFVIMVGLISIKSCRDNVKIQEKISIKEIHDTIWPKPVIVYLPSKVNPVAIKEIKIENPDTNLCKVERVYSDSLIDSNQTIYYNASTIGRLKGIQIGYKLKIPLRINTTREITIEKFNTKSPNFTLSGGLSVIGNMNQFDIAPIGIATFNNKSIFYSYHILQNQHQIGVAIRLFKTKK